MLATRGTFQSVISVAQGDNTPGLITLAAIEDSGGNFGNILMRGNLVVANTLPTFSGERVMYLEQAETVPSSSPATGVLMYNESGTLKVRGASSTALELVGDLDMGGNDLTDIGLLGDNWTGLSFGTGWSNYGGSWNSGSYKRVGDLVFLRGMVQRTSGTGTLIATLPVGYRPSGHQRIVRSTAGGYVEIDVQTDGTIDLTSGTYSTFVSLSSIVFGTA